MGTAQYTRGSRLRELLLDAEVIGYRPTVSGRLVDSIPTSGSEIGRS